MSSDPSVYAELGERAWSWVLTQVREGQAGVWLTERPDQTEPGVAPYGMHSGVGGLAHAMAEFRLYRPLSATELDLCREIEATAAIAPAGTTLTWVDGKWLTEQGLTGVDLPLWSEGVVDWQSAMSPARAEAAGLVHRPLDQIVRDTAAWATDAHLVDGVGLTPAREAELLARWTHRAI